MKPPSRISRWVAVGLTSCVVVLAAITSASASSNSQTILSATGVPTTEQLGATTRQGVGGFWIWAQPGGSNAYGEEGAGSIYFYDLLPAEHPVDVDTVTIIGNTVTESLHSTDGLITCPSFMGTETSPGHGTVSLTCIVQTRFGTVTVTATNVRAQVNISTIA